MNWLNNNLHTVNLYIAGAFLRWSRGTAPLKSQTAPTRNIVHISLRVTGNTAQSQYL